VLRAGAAAQLRPARIWRTYHVDTFGREAPNGLLVTGASIDDVIAFFDESEGDNLIREAHFVAEDPELLDEPHFRELHRIGHYTSIVDLRHLGRSDRNQAMPAFVYALRCRPLDVEVDFDNYVDFDNDVDSGRPSPPAMTPWPFCPHALSRMLKEGAAAAGLLSAGWHPAFGPIERRELMRGVFDVFARLTRRLEKRLGVVSMPGQEKRALGQPVTPKLTGRKSDKAKAATPRRRK
jgi:hypothetical protein